VLAACTHAGPNDNDTGAHPMDKKLDAGRPTAKTALDQVQAAAPPGASVVDIGLGIPGLTVFRIDNHAPVPADGQRAYRYVALAGVGSPMLEGDEMYAAIAKQVTDAKRLAEIILTFRDASPLAGPDGSEFQKKRGVTAPVIANGALDFWFMWGAPSRSLYHGHLDLATGKLDTAVPGPDEDEALASQIDRAKQSADPTSIRAIAKHCDKPAVRDALFEVLAKHRREDMRAEAAMAVEACGAAAVDPLIAALADKTSVSATAASTLGKIGDKRAKAALEKAAASSDSELAAEAKKALTKLH